MIGKAIILIQPEPEDGLKERCRNVPFWPHTDMPPTPKDWISQLPAVSAQHVLNLVHASR